MNKRSVLSMLTVSCMLFPGITFAAARANLPHVPAADVAMDIAKAVVNPQAMKWPASCDDVKMDDTQKGQIKDALFDFMKQKNTMMADIKNAMMDEMKTFASKDSTKDDATAAQAATKQAMDALHTAHDEVALKIFFDILKPEQRDAAVTCFMDMHQQKKAGKKH